MMLRIFTAGSVAADLTYTVLMMSERSIGGSVSLAMLAATSICLSLWGMASALHRLADPAFAPVRQAPPSKE